MFEKWALMSILVTGLSACAGHDDSEREWTADDVGDESDAVVDVQRASDCGSGLMVLGKGCCYCYKGDYHDLDGKCARDAMGYTFTYEAFCFE